VESR
jgi:HAD superfamily hydrolase (TIGR01509 family)